MEGGLASQSELSRLGSRQGGEMKKLRVAFLSTAAGFSIVAAAQAGEIPTLKPISFVKICSVYGEGFFYQPGTDTCLKLGGYLRVQAENNAGAGGIVVGSQQEGSQGRFTR